jgi:hypothetical protein
MEVQKMFVLQRSAQLLATYDLKTTFIYFIVTLVKVKSMKC